MSAQDIILGARVAHVRELKAEIEKLGSAAVPPAQKEGVKGELGDLLFSVCNLARHLGVDSESALEGTTAKFARRFRAVEAGAKAKGKSLKDMSLAEMDALWDKAKSGGGALTRLVEALALRRPGYDLGFGP